MKDGGHLEGGGEVEGGAGGFAACQAVVPPPPAGETVPGCNAVVPSPPVVLAHPDPDFWYATFVPCGDGIVGVWSGEFGAGYHAVDFTTAGEIRSSGQPWPGNSSASPHLAASGDVLAVVDQVSVGVQGRQSCRLGLARVPGFTAITPPTRFSDATNDDTILNEVQACDLATAGENFLAVWQQVVSDITGAQSLFAQRFSRDGEPVGERLTLVEGEDKVRGTLSVASDGDRALVLYGEELFFVEADGVRTVTVIPESTGGESAFSSVSGVHGRVLLRTSGEVTVLDHGGIKLEGPVDFDWSWRVAPLGPAYVGVSHDEFLTATVLNEHLSPASLPAGLSLARHANLQHLLVMPDGGETFALYRDSDLKLTELSCADEPAPPPGPACCASSESFAPLDDGCTDDVCHSVLRLDYLTLGVLGYTVRGGGAALVDAQGAREVAASAFSDMPDLSSELQVEPARAGVFHVSDYPGDFGAFALVGAESSTVIAAGGIVWDGRGDYWEPTEWSPAGDIVCGDVAAEPADSSSGGPASCDGEAPAPKASDALATALRTNLAAGVAARGSFSAFTYLYTPTVGGCDPRVAEYLVVLTQERR